MMTKVAPPAPIPAITPLLKPLPFFGSKPSVVPFFIPDAGPVGKAPLELGGLAVGLFCDEPVADVGVEVAVCVEIVVGSAMPLSIISMGPPGANGKLRGLYRRSLKNLNG